MTSAFVSILVGNNLLPSHCEIRLMICIPTKRRSPPKGGSHALRCQVLQSQSQISTTSRDPRTERTRAQPMRCLAPFPVSRSQSPAPPQIKALTHPFSTCNSKTCPTISPPARTTHLASRSLRRIIELGSTPASAPVGDRWYVSYKHPQPF